MGANDSPRLGRAAWLFPTALALHNLEESIWMPRFWRLHQMKIPYTATEFRIAAAALVLLAAAITAWAQIRGSGTLPARLFLIFCFAMWLNAFWHIGLSIYFRGYAPGVVTAVALMLPVTSYLMWDPRKCAKGIGAASGQEINLLF